MGRKKTGRKIRIQVGLTAEQYERFERLAEQAQRSMSNLASIVLQSYMTDNTRTDDETD